MTKYISTAVAFEKMRHYCMWQERCCSEVKNKLLLLGINKLGIENILRMLIVEGTIDECRFAKLYAGGKFRIKKWGRFKIEQSLREKKISEKDIKEAMTVINEKEYLETLEKMAMEKWEKSDEIEIIKRKNKIQFYLSQKGYELHLILEITYKLSQEKKGKK